MDYKNGASRKLKGGEKENLLDCVIFVGVQNCWKRSGGGDLWFVFVEDKN
jgi:hypothetical protein